MKEIIYQGTNMVKTFGETTVLQGISLKLYKGDFTVIMGSSGSGKSTLLYAISGMDRLSGGQLFYKGKQSDGKTSSDGMLDIAHASEKELTRLRAENFGFVFQRTHLVSSLTLEENIRMAGLICGSMTEKQIREKTDALICQMRLEKAKDRLPAQVSGGEAQRAAVARAVVTKPRILFADEPTGALDSVSAGQLLALLTELNGQEKATVLMVTHDPLSASYGNRVLFLKDGQINKELRRVRQSRGDFYHAILSEVSAFGGAGLC